MKIKENQICRVCLRADTSEIFEEIGGTIKEILEVLQLKVNSYISKKHVACSNCKEIIHKCFGFKSTCMNIENLIVPFYNFESESKLDLRKVYMHTNMNKATDDIPKDQEICRFCMTFNKSSFCEPLVEIEKGKLQKCIPELNLNLTKEPVICDSCLNYLQFYYQFLQTFENTEEQIIRYCKSKTTSSEGQINLSKVVQFIKNTFKNDRNINILGSDGLCSEIKENVIKTEMIIKEEKVEFDEEHARTDIKTDIGEYITKSEMNDESFEPQDEKLDMIYEQCKSETKQSNFASFGNVHTSSQSIMGNITTYNPRDHVVTDQDNSEVRLKNLEDLDEIKSAHNYQNSTGVMTYNCQNCPFVTKHKKSLKVHMLTHHEVKVYMCESCPYVTKVKGNLNRHMLVHRDLSEVPVYKCQNCSFVTKHKISIELHMLTHRELSEVTVYACESCPYVTKYKNRLKKHDKLIHRSSEVTLHTCDQCVFQTKYEKSLKRHMLTHQKPLEPNIYYKCRSCSFVTKAKSYLQKHNKRVHESSEITCYLCSFKAGYKYDLKRHMLIHQELGEAKMYKCHSCSFITKHQGSLTAHLLTHRELSEIKSYTCESCSYVTNRKGNLKKHLLTHREFSEVTVYTCESCQFTTKRKDSLKSHILTHRKLSEVTVYTCESCSFTTRHKGSLKSHMLTHRELSEIRVYACESCSYVARQKGNLKSHMLTHRELSDVKVYTCESCSFVTTLEESLKTHMLTHQELQK